ncbi:MAG: helix-turn-helix domain-containing protein [bacterium]
MSARKRTAPAFKPSPELRAAIEKLTEYAEQSHSRWQTPTGRGWRRLHEVLQAAALDPEIAAAPNGAGVMVELLLECLGDALDDTPDNVFAPMVALFPDGERGTAQREHLSAQRKRRSQARQARRLRIVAARDAGETVSAIADREGISERQVQRDLGN